MGILQFLTTTLWGGWLLLLLTTAMYVPATFLLKISNGFSNLYAGIIGWGMAMAALVLYGFAMKNLPYSIAAPASSCISIVGMALVGLAFLSEPFNW